MSYQSHLKAAGNRKAMSIGQIREHQIREGQSYWSKSYENIHSNINQYSHSSSSLLPLKPPVPPSSTNGITTNSTIPDKEAIIIALQLEVERLKSKVNTIIKTSEETITDFTLQHDSIKDDYTNEYNELLKNYNDTVNDRDKYKNIADNLSKVVQQEQDNLRQTMKHLASSPSSPVKSLASKQDNADNDNIQIHNYMKLEALAKAETVAVLSLLKELINDSSSSSSSSSSSNIESSINDRKEIIVNNNNDTNDEYDNNVTINNDVNNTITIRTDSELQKLWVNYDNSISFKDFFDTIVIKVKQIKANEITNINNYNNIINNLQTEKKSLETDNDKASDIIRNLNQRLTMHQSNITDSNKIKQENDELNQQLKEITVNYEESHARCMKLEQEVMSLTSVEKEYQLLKINERSLELEVSKTKALEEKIASLEKSNSNYHDEIQIINKLKGEIADRTNDAAKANEQLKSVTEQYESSKNKCSNLEEELIKANHEHDMLATLLSAMEERNANLDKQLEATTASNADLKKDKQLKQEEIITLRKQCDVLEGKHKNANSRVAALEASLVELSTEFRSLTEKDCDKFHSTLKEYEERLEAATADKENLVTSLNQVTKERDESFALQSALSQLTEEMEFKINQLEKDKRVLSDANNNTCALNDELQQTTTNFFNVATSSIKDLEEKVRVLSEERDQLLLSLSETVVMNEDIVNNVDDVIKEDNKVNTTVTEKNDMITIPTIPFNPLQVESSTGFSFIQCISAMDEYNSFSFEELRYYKS